MNYSYAQFSLESKRFDVYDTWKFISDLVHQEEISFIIQCLRQIPSYP